MNDKINNLKIKYKKNKNGYRLAGALDIMNLIDIVEKLEVLIRDVQRQSNTELQNIIETRLRMILL